MDDMIEFIKPDFSFADERGALTQLCREGWKQINVTSSKAGVFRGGHYHKNKKEAFYIIKGEIEIQLTKDGREETVTVKSALKEDQLAQLDKIVEFMTK